MLEKEDFGGRAKGKREHAGTRGMPVQAGIGTLKADVCLGVEHPFWLACGVDRRYASWKQRSVGLCTVHWLQCLRYLCLSGPVEKNNGKQTLADQRSALV